MSFTWNAAGINNNDARHKLALNTCSGCHLSETGAGFLHVGNRSLGSPSVLSGFLTGTSILDPVDFTTPRKFNDLKRRARDLSILLTR